MNSARLSYFKDRKSLGLGNTRGGEKCEMAEWPKIYSGDLFGNILVYSGVFRNLFRIFRSSSPYAEKKLTMRSHVSAPSIGLPDLVNSCLGHCKLMGITHRTNHCGLKLCCIFVGGTGAKHRSASTPPLMQRGQHRLGKIYMYVK